MAENIFDNTGMTNKMHDYFSNLWCDDSPLIPGAPPEWIHKRWNSEALAGYRELTGYFIKEVAFSFSRGKVGAGDRIVIEMIRELGEVILQELAEVFKVRVLNHASQDNEEAWDFHQVSLILKAAPRCPSLLRPIFNLIRLI